MRFRHEVLWLTAFGGIFIATGGALVAAGSYALSAVPWVVGAVMLVAADRRLRQVKRSFEIMYDGESAEDEMYVDGAGPFGWMREGR